MTIIAQQVTGPGGDGQLSTGVLGAILGGGLLASIIAAYRFTVNYRQTERGMRAQAMRDRRRAYREAGLWQERCADLTYLLKSNNIPPPKFDPELQKLIDMSEDDTPLSKWDDPSGPGERLER